MASKNLTAHLKRDPHSTTAKPEETVAPVAVQTESKEKDRQTKG